MTTPQRPRALVCEDEGITVMQLRRTLQRAGYDVVGEAADGARAIEIAAREQPDLVVMDINIQGQLDGITAMQRILRDRFVPVIILTAYSDEERVERALDAGACAYVVKPVTSTQLLPAIRTAVRRFETLQTAIAEATDIGAAQEARRLIEAAHARLMKEQGLGEDEAFEALQVMMRDRGVSATDAARAVLGMGPAATG